MEKKARASFTASLVSSVMERPCHADGPGFRAETRAAAFGAGCIPSVTAQENADVEFVFLAFEPIEEAFDAFEIVFGVAFQNETALLARELAPGDVERNASATSPFFHVLEERAVARLGPRLDRAFIKRLTGIGHDETEIEIDGVAETLAARAGAVGIVERKKTGLGLLIKRAIVFAFEAFVE